jgi:hypothetical protein
MRWRGNGVVHHYLTAVLTCSATRVWQSMATHAILLATVVQRTLMLHTARHRNRVRSAANPHSDRTSAVDAHEQHRRRGERCDDAGAADSHLKEMV